jgi:hypothetical protein
MKKSPFVLSPKFNAEAAHCKDGNIVRSEEGVVRSGR